MKSLKKALLEWKQANKLFNLGLIDNSSLKEKRKEILRKNLGILL